MSFNNVPPPNFNSKSHSFGKIDGRQRMTDSEKERMYNELSSQNHGKSTSKASDEADDDYFEQNSSDEEERKPSSRGQKRRSEKIDNDDEEDELDAFMAGINKEATEAVKESKTKEQHLIETGDFTGGQEGRDDIEEEDMQESMIKFMEEYKERQEEEEQIYEYDEDGNIIWTWKKEIDPLPSIDHSTIQYKPFNKNFYNEHDEVKALTPEQTFELRLALDIRVYGRNPPKPVCSFDHFQFDRGIMAQIRKSEFEKPTPIQAQAVPIALSGRDCLGLAKTGSGKTLAYIWPSIVHIMNQTELSPGDGPIALIIVPTRELALQVYNEARKYTNSYNIATVCAYGGGSKYEQQKALEEGAELVIGTPGRIIDLVKIGATNFLRTTFLVFDEVDRMFDLGFEQQVKSIADHIRPDRQCLVFSATCKAKIEKLVIHALYDPIKILCGDIGEVNTDVHQKIVVVKDEEEKYHWLFANIVKFITMGKVLIFVTKKIESEDVAKKLQLRDIELVHLHGDMHQQERNSRITSFRTTMPVMVATDVAARGLDIPAIQNVLNFSVAKDIETHIHRVGRTGRAGHQGNAYTLITEKDAEFAAKLIKNLEASSQEQAITPELIAVANKCAWFKEQYEKQQKQSNTAVLNFDGSRGGTTFKPKERPGFGLKKPIGSGEMTGHSFASTSSQPSISKQIERAKSLVDPGNAEMSKMAMMRSALKSTFKHSFQASSAGDEFTVKIAASDPRPEWKIRLEEQAAKINKALQEQQQQEEEGSGKTKKRSRWGEFS